MAKNPVFPLYYNDIDRSTRDWTDEEFGCYVRLLLHQWDKFGLPLGFDRLSRIATSVEKNWDIIGPKFQEVGGLLKNAKLEEIRTARMKESDKQSDNGKKGGRPKKNETQTKPKQNPIYNPDINPNKSLHNEYEYEINNTEVLESRDRIGVQGKGKGWNQKPGLSERSLELPESKMTAVIELLRISTGKSPTREDISGLWSVFKVQNFTGENYYQSPEKTYSHFVNWSKQQKINGSHQQQPNRSNPKTAGVNKLLGKIHENLSARGSSDIGS
jgi:uncharacterized protein YdaU (DUF1376 family)